MMLTPAAILASALKDHLAATADHKRQQLDLANAAGLKLGTVIQAMRGFAINAEAHLRLCAALNIDPNDGTSAPIAARVGEFDIKLLGAGLFMRRLQRKQSIRNAAGEMALSHATLLKIEQGEVTAIGSVLAACTYIGVSPFHYVKPPMFHRNNGLTTLNEQEKSANGP